MTVRQIIECNYCGTKTLTRTIMGFIENVPLRVPCCGCGVVLRGTLTMIPEDVDYRIKFSNAKLVGSSEGEPEYTIELSGELMTKKVEKYEFATSLISPVIKNLMFHGALTKGKNNIEDFKFKFKSLIGDRSKEWQTLKDVEDLWNNRNYKIIKKVISSFPEFEYLKEISDDYKNIELEAFNLKNISFSTIITQITPNDFAEKRNNLEDQISLSLNNPNKLYSLIIENKESCEELQKKLFSQIGKIVERFENLIPIFGLKYLGDMEDNFFDNKGITTVTFEEIKDIYIDNYEVILSCSDIVIAIDNLIINNDFNNMQVTGASKTKTLSKYRKLSNGHKLNFINENESYFNKLLESDLDKEIRNSIGHNSYSFDSVSQNITFKKNNGSSKKMSLVLFLMKLWDSFITCYNLWYFYKELNKLRIILSLPLSTKELNRFIRDYSIR
ncbi:hypothetical protein [Ilyobacter polytropus]|uniref:SEC-C motif domain protein n=1 Tax=Ilyobacter polytropus (strain ATCC 51220 / DSM 2926 / LMG 16218 / CuHBu1) TaxID=572544 RepID=E3H8C6_ILYPC|nr:hypothetical protein [Ilyobacter polytropus]ADO82693.1 hypothetical protein Ilyop_0910 [Ilyobacter polytropus DSM 2926]